MCCASRHTPWTGRARRSRNLPVTWSYTYDPGDHDIVAPGATAEIDDGAFVAEVPGQYTVIALAGPLSARAVLEIERRDAVQRSTVVGQGNVHGWGGSPEDPVFVAQKTTPGGNTHAVFPYYQESTGSFYIYAGDEVMSRAGRALGGSLTVDPYDPETGEGGVPSSTAGYVHIIDFSDPANPKKVAKYAPMVWSAMPYKGTIFFSDWNSGLWSVRLEGDAAPITMR